MSRLPQLIANFLHPGVRGSFRMMPFYENQVQGPAPWLAQNFALSVRWIASGRALVFKLHLGEGLLDDDAASTASQHLANSRSILYLI